MVVECYCFLIIIIVGGCAPRRLVFYNTFVDFCLNLCNCRHFWTTREIDTLLLCRFSCEGLAFWSFLFLSKKALKNLLVKIKGFRGFFNFQNPKNCFRLRAVWFLPLFFRSRLRAVDLASKNIRVFDHLWSWNKQKIGFVYAPLVFLRRYRKY